DLKPGNVLLVSGKVVSGEWSSQTTHHSPLTTHHPPGTTPKITDFGLAKRLDGPGQSVTGEVMGTPAYLAPEQAEGKVKEVGPAADIYSLGTILYECLTGRPPFKAPTSAATVLQVIHNDPVPLRVLQPQTPRDLEVICLKCLRKESAKRYRTA